MMASIRGLVVSCTSQFAIVSFNTHSTIVLPPLPVLHVLTLEMRVCGTGEEVTRRSPCAGEGSAGLLYQRWPSSRSRISVAMLCLCVGGLTVAGAKCGRSSLRQTADTPSPPSNPVVRDPHLPRDSSVGQKGHASHHQDEVGRLQVIGSTA